MKRLTSFICLALLACPAMADDDQKTVNSGDHVVTSTAGSCVRTKWQAPGDVCAPKKPVAKAEAAPVAPPVKVVAAAKLSDKEARTIYFDFNKDTLRADADKTLTQLVGLIKADGKVTQLHVVGYADTIGGDSKKNLALSQRRADAVKARLAESLNIPSDSSVKGLGVSHTAECSKKESRAKRIACLQPDRRVEVEVSYEQK